MLNRVLGNQILAVLFSALEPVTMDQFADVFPGLEVDDLKQELDTLISEFNSLQRAVEIRSVAGGYRMTTLPEHHEVIRGYLKTKPAAKLSQAALETLATVAYKQPITLPEISDIRGVSGSSTIKTLLERNLIEIRGRKKVVGRPIVYGTTQEFLIRFGLNDLSELPSLEEFEELSSISETLADSGTDQRLLGFRSPDSNNT